MPDIAAEGVVCLACRYGSDCIWEAVARSPILQCEEFELASAEPHAGPTPAVRSAAAASDGDELAGLCSNCDVRETCIYPKPEGGVWRCEEYR